MNEELHGVSLINFDDPSKVVMLFDSDANVRNASGDLHSAACRHLDRANVMFADGHVEVFKPDEVA